MSSLQFIATLFCTISLSLAQFIVIKNYQSTQNYYLTFILENIDASQCGDSISEIYIYQNDEWRPKNQEYNEPEGYRVAFDHTTVAFGDMVPISVRISRTSGINIDLWAIITTITDTSAVFTSTELICGGTLTPSIPSLAPTTKTPTAPTTAYPTAQSVCIAENALNWRSYNNQIYLNGNIFNMKGISWFGFETSSYMLHGLATYGTGSNSYTFYLDFLAQNGFNAIRIPFSQDMVDNNPIIGSQHIDAPGNSIFNGKTALECMDIIIDAAGERGILIMLDFHSKNADSYTQGMNDINLLTAQSTWETLGDRYKNKWNIFMADILNEPHDVGNWNEGTTYKWADYINYCENVAEKLLLKGVNWLFMVQGTNANCLIRNMNIYCSWGGNLQGIDPSNSAYAKTFIISEPNRLIWSPHVYGPGISNNAYSSQIWSNHWGYLCDGSYPLNKAACVIGEFGSWYNWNDGIIWMDSLINYLISIKQRNTYFWCLNPDSGDTGGLLHNDWTTPITNKLIALDILQPSPTMITFYSNSNLVCFQFNGTHIITTPPPANTNNPTKYPTKYPIKSPTESPFTPGSPSRTPTNPSLNPTNIPTI
eukprot:391580_1